MHTALAAPFVAITVSATLQGFDHNQARAGARLVILLSVLLLTTLELLRRRSERLRGIRA